MGQIIKILCENKILDFYIAGFDMEHNRYASDESLYDNGYGICLVPKSDIATSSWYNYYSSDVPYIRSIIHTSVLPTIASNLQVTLGDHLINRRVLLGSNIDKSVENDSNPFGLCINKHTWTTSHCTLMSMHQYSGYGMSAHYSSSSGDHIVDYDKYGNGEANYMLPIFGFNYFMMTKIITNDSFWLRNMIYIRSVYNVTGYSVAVGSPVRYDEEDKSDIPNSTFNLNFDCPYRDYGKFTNYIVRPMIYIR